MASIGEIIRVVAHYSMENAGDMQNVFHFILQTAAIADNDLIDDVSAWFQNDWGASWQELASQYATLEHFDADVVDVDGTVKRNLGGDIIDLDGLISTELMTPMDSGYLLAYTAIPKARGSKYLPGMAEATQSAGGLNATALADLAVCLGVYLVPIAMTGGGSLLPGVASATLAAFVPFLVSGAIDTVLATQRRRKAGVGI